MMLSPIVGYGLPPTESPYPTKSHDFESSTSDGISRSAASFSGIEGITKVGLSFWFRSESVSSAHYFFGSGPIASFINGGTGTIRWRGFLSGSNFTLNTNEVFTGTGTWRHVFAFHDDSLGTGDKQQVWIDGVRVTSFATNTQGSGTTTATGADVSWGCNYSGGVLNPYDGQLYQCAVFTGTLPTIADLYNNGKPKDIRNVTGLYSLLEPDVSVTKDKNLSDWTSRGSVTTSTAIP